MTWTTPGYVASGEADSGKFNSETVDNLQHLYDRMTDGVWTDYTPVITQGGTVTATVNRARYHRAGRKITGDVYAIVTGGAGAPTTTIDVSLPVTPAATSGNTIAGEGWIFDASTNAFWFGTMLISSSGAVRFLRRQDGVTSAFLATSGMTSALAVGDILSFTFAYEAAS